ncbi:uncharacterized protein LOC116287721, partial [Actinia tenebrosa]|uniref:Uncharacterized protein LOC116287721 n=1 Tax=Actinia tenebrosa TaxID=6105 RepID=A0A6P8H3X9_ACTTE
MKNRLVGQNWNSFLFVLVSLLIVQFQETLGDCKNMILLPEQQGYNLRHHSVQNLTDVTKDVCQITCYMHESCMSYNYYTRSAICEINDSDEYRNPDDLVNKEDSMYIGTDNACKSSPCPSNATCTP